MPASKRFTATLNSLKDVGHSTLYIGLLINRIEFLLPVLPFNLFE